MAEMLAPAEAARADHRGGRALGALGAAAGFARAAGLARPLRAATRVADVPFVLAGRPPLRDEIRELPFHGYLRHRSFLAGEVRPETSYCELFERSLRPGPTVVDGGAHSRGIRRRRGASRQMRRRPRLEPDPYNFRALAHNARRLAPGRIGLSRKALAGTAGRAGPHPSGGAIGSASRAWAPAPSSPAGRARPAPSPG